jgi:hypothetical protein
MIEKIECIRIILAIANQRIEWLLGSSSVQRDEIEELIRKNGTLSLNGQDD